MPATDICHPVEQRPLSIQEYKRLQMFEWWQLGGKLVDQYRQVGNAVPSGLGEAVGRAIFGTHGKSVSSTSCWVSIFPLQGTDEVSWEAATEKSLDLTPERPTNKKFTMTASQMKKGFV